MENTQEIQKLLQDYELSETELLQTRKLYEQLEHIVLQENEKRRKEETEASSVKRLSSDITPITNATNSKISTKTSKDVKSSPSLSSTKSFNLETRPNISKSVKRRIHHFENYKNILKQAKVAPEKLAFLDLLNNSD